LLRIIPTLSHSSDEVFEDMNDYIFSIKGDGNFLPGAGLDPKKVIAVVCDNASANTSLVSKINDWLSKFNETNEPKHMIYPIYCFAHSIHRVVLVLLEYVDLETTEIRTYVKSLHRSPKLSNQLTLKICERNKSFPQNDAVKIFKKQLDVKTC
jgi:hypothetical protein